MGLGDPGTERAARTESAARRGLDIERRVGIVVVVTRTLILLLATVFVAALLLEGLRTSGAEDGDRAPISGPREMCPLTFASANSSHSCVRVCACQLRA